MNLKNINLATLSSIDLSQKEQLPEYAGIYFVMDSQDKLLYIGQAQNIRTRWRNHHRYHQFKEITQKNKIKIAWLAWNQEDLTIAENYLIKYYQPFFNRTKVKRIKTIASETTLIELLERIRLLIVILGVQTSKINQLNTVYIKYDYYNSGQNGCAQIIKTFKKELKNKNTNLQIKRYRYGEYRTHNTRPGSREHKQISRLKSSYNNHWQIPCNGTILDITPIRKDEFQYLRSSDTSQWVKLAQIKIRAVKNQKTIASLISSLKGDKLQPVPMIDDPIPLIV